MKLGSDLDGHRARESPEVSPGDAKAFVSLVVVEVIQNLNCPLQAIVVRVVEVDAAVAATNAVMETCNSA